MRKLIAIFICTMLVICAAQAEELDLESMPLSELLELQSKVNQAIFNSPEWKEVEIPMGVWDIGKDIPAGRWEIAAGPNADKYTAPHIWYYLTRSEKNNTPNDLRADYKVKQGETLVIDLYDGNVIKIEDTSLIFRRYVASFSFN